MENSLLFYLEKVKIESIYSTLSVAFKPHLYVITTVLDTPLISEEI